MSVKTARVKLRHQLTIPLEVRKDLGIQEGDDVAFVKIEGGYIFKKVNSEQIRDFLLTDKTSIYNA